MIDNFVILASRFSLWFLLYRACTAGKEFRYSFRSTEFIKNHRTQMDSVMDYGTLVDDSSAQKLTEVGDLLARGLLRLLREKSSRFPDDFGESSLPISPDQSGDAPVYSAEVSP